ncbi:TSUP family transporter [Falsiroseomonas ponticola]|uniref:TSUP family transporter n=1 Tax=Falsiroseomonas ponticola TaxID=2786951 RepID=UPI00193330B8|nr:TSUP family transporter [Roseomonas ponticola]
MGLGMMALLLAVMVGTSLLSGIFGMAGGLVLVGVLLVLMPLPDAMALHAVTQVASNAWRAAFLLRHVRWRIAGAYALGCILATAGWSLFLWVPDKPLALIALGISPFLLKLLPAAAKPDAARPSHGTACGIASMSLMLLTGVSGPLTDAFFLGGRMERHAIVATKAVCQMQAHLLKLLYFGAMVADPGQLDPLLAGGAVLASMLGTVLARKILDALTEAQFRRWAGRIVTAIAVTYIAHGSWLLVMT